MLIFPELLPEENKPYEEKVNRTANRRMATHLVPCFFHFCTPMDIIENENTIIIDPRQDLFKIAEGGIAFMIPINKNKVRGGHLLQGRFQQVIKISGQNGAISDSNGREIFSCLLSNG